MTKRKFLDKTVLLQRLHLMMVVYNGKSDWESGLKRSLENVIKLVEERPEYTSSKSGTFWEKILFDKIKLKTLAKCLIFLGAIGASIVSTVSMFITIGTVAGLAHLFILSVLWGVAIYFLLSAEGHYD